MQSIERHRNDEQQPSNGDGNRQNKGRQQRRESLIYCTSGPVQYGSTGPPPPVPVHGFGFTTMTQTTRRCVAPKKERLVFLSDIRFQRSRSQNVIRTGMCRSFTTTSTHVIIRDYTWVRGWDSQSQLCQVSSSSLVLHSSPVQLQLYS